MNKDYITINGRCFLFDIDAIMKWCLSSKENPVKEYELTEGYDLGDEGTVGSKVVRELRSPNTQDDTIRYDFLKMLISPYFSDVTSFEEINNDFSLSLSFNTLWKMGFITEITL